MSKIKVGDRIRIYHDHFTNTGVVEIIEDNLLAALLTNEREVIADEV